MGGRGKQKTKNRGGPGPRMSKYLVQEGVTDVTDATDPKPRDVRVTEAILTSVGTPQLNIHPGVRWAPRPSRTSIFKKSSSWASSPQNVCLRREGCQCCGCARRANACGLQAAGLVQAHHRRAQRPKIFEVALLKGISCCTQAHADQYGTATRVHLFGATTKASHR